MPDTPPHATPAGLNAIVGYDWPLPIRPPRGLALLLATPELYRQALRAPGQIASALAWANRQAWADPHRVSLLGFSLGALVAPAAQRLASARGHPVGYTILAYGGAPLGALFAANPHTGPVWVRAAMGWLIDLFLRPLEPTLHLPLLTGRFLSLAGSDDRLIPASARARLNDAIPAPKEVLTLAGDHMGVGAEKAALLRAVIETSQGWLVRQGAIDRP